MGAVNGYVAIILILATILLMVCIALFYLLGNYNVYFNYSNFHINDIEVLKLSEKEIM